MIYSDARRIVIPDLIGDLRPFRRHARPDRASININVILNAHLTVILNEVKDL